MGIVDDVLRAFDRIPIWQRIQEVPKEVDELKAKVAALEEKLGGKWPHDVCKYCGHREARLHATNPTSKGDAIEQNWRCFKCGNHEIRIVKPGAS
jgi:ribosomal protein L32